MSLSVDFSCPWCERTCHGIPFGGVGETICAECWFGDLMPSARDDEEQRQSYREAFGGCLNCAVGDEAAAEMLRASLPCGAGGGAGG